MKIQRPSKQLGYYSVLGFEREPFATSPDPEFFYHTQQHEQALTNLLIELRLRRGLSVVFGDVGTGKTTLSRKLLHELNQREDIIFHVILNPAFSNESQFLLSLIRNFDIDVGSGDVASLDVMELRDVIERFLIQKTLEEDRTVVLVIDEAQKLDLTTLESLRILLNFETNDHKLIQLIILGQLELYAKIVHMQNFLDRISFKFTLNPLDLTETTALIEFRVRTAGYRGQRDLFTPEAISEIYVQTAGYPRKINMLCHKTLKALVASDKNVIDQALVGEVVSQEQQWMSSMNEVVLHSAHAQ